MKLKQIIDIYILNDFIKLVIKIEENTSKKYNRKENIVIKTFL
jgi:hypothetical protein